ALGAWLGAKMVAAQQAPGEQAGIDADRPVVYFCSEFAIHGSLPLYGGGLGVLAGDVLKAASHLAITMVVSAPFYRRGYFPQPLDDAGWQHEWWTPNDFDCMPAALVSGPDGQPLTVAVE